MYTFILFEFTLFLHSMKSYFLLFLTSVDQSLGRIDKHLLSQQTLMELFVEPISNGDKLCGSKENPKDISTWQGVILDRSTEVIDITWPYMALQGSIELRWLPLTLTDVYVHFNFLRGRVDLTCLPEALRALDISENKFEGEIDLTKLPRGMQRLSLRSNGFTGKTDFSQLPQAMTALSVSSTHLEGEIFEFDGNLSTKNSNVKDMRKNPPESWG